MKLASNHSINYSDLEIAVEVNKDNNIISSFMKVFVKITPTLVEIHSFDDVDRWYNDDVLYNFQQFKFAL